MKNSTTFWTTLGGALLGYLILHPYAMIVFFMYERDGLKVGDFFHQLTFSFKVDMLPMGLPFAMLGALAGLFLGLWVTSRKNKAETKKQIELLENQLRRLNRGE